MITRREVTCNSIEIVLSECSNERTIYDKFDIFLIGSWLGWLVGIKLGKYGGSELGF